MEIFNKGISEKEFSRRQLITGAGKVAVGLTVVSAGAITLACGADAKKQVDYPWPYKKLDPDKVAVRAYENWYKHFCAYATAEAILGSLQEEVGEPYTSLPLLAFAWGHGGGVGWGMTCGTLMGTGMATAFVAGKKGDNIINDLMHYYAETELPLFKPANPKATFKNINKSESPLCHVSVGRWMEKEGVKFGSPQRKDRCARLSADIAKKTVELLNLYADGKYKSAHGNQIKMFGITTQNNCTDCHGSEVPSI
jgi:hypothetical protein